MQARVEAAGGQILFWNGVRVMGVLAVSRAIGDHCLRPFVIAQPEVSFMFRQPLCQYNAAVAGFQTCSCVLSSFLTIEALLLLLLLLFASDTVLQPAPVSDMPCHAECRSPFWHASLTMSCCCLLVTVCCTSTSH